MEDGFLSQKATWVLLSCDPLSSLILFNLEKEQVQDEKRKS